ncbi:MAG: hypothetical protein MR346_09715 [Clostridium sp.]|nr:hypothetical protein [Clostridium sp.]
MNCVITGVSISNDVDNRLAKTVATVAKTDNTKANILSALLNNDANVEFKWYLWNHLTENDFLKDANININDLTAFTNKDYVNIKQNKLAKLLNDFYEYKYPSINNSKTNKAEGSLNGFLTGSAKSLAKTETAKLIIEEYGKDMFLPKNKRRDRYTILKEVNKRILNEFYNRVNNYIAEINNPDNTNYNKNAEKDINEYLHILDRIKELKFQRSSLNATITELKNNRSDLLARRGQLNTLNKTASVEEQAVNNATIADINTELNQIETRLKESNDSLDTLKNPIAQLNYVKYVLANNIVNDHINSYIGVQKNRLINYRNLVEQTRNNADNWYNQVYHHKTMTDIVKSMELTENLDQYLAGVDTNEDELIDTNNTQNVDETTKSWEDNLYKSFDNAVSGKLKLLIAQLDNLSQPFNENAELQAIDTNNELGVSTKMNVQKVINNIFSFADYSNINNFINSIEEKSKNVKALYGLGSLVKTMKERRDIANFVFVNFAKPIVHKVILNVQNIANRENISLDYSNNSAFNTTATIFNLANKLRLTYNEVYNDKHDEDIRQLFKDFNDNKISNTNFIKSLQDFLNIYFPNINKDSISNAIISIINDKESKDKLRGLEGTIQSLLTNIRNMKVEINKQLQAIDNFNRDRDVDNDRKRQQIIERARTINPNISNNELNELVKEEISKVIVPYKDTNDIDFSISSATYSSIYNLVNFLSNFNESSARLNTANAEGHSASDVIKNNWITRFFDQLQDETGKGLEVLRDYFTQGINEHGYNQYSNNPLLFGVKNGNGVIVHNGLFNSTNGGFDINKNAAQIIRYSLFDGSKNTSNNDGKGYSKMSKLDFFITQFEAFVKGIPEFTNNGYLSKIQDTDNAVYSMRIGSDAPKIFFIRAPKYNNTDVRRAIYGHVLDEINMFINGLDRIFVQEGKVLVPRKNVTNLYGRLYYDEKKATKLIQDGKTDLTEAITDGKRLYGNAFKFNRLFKVLDAETKGEKYYDAGEEIEAALSLYGGGNTTALFSTDNNGRLVLTPNDVIRYEDGHFVLHLDNEQKKMIMNAVNKWANNYLWECKNRLNEFMNVFNNIGIEYNEEEVNSFLLNTANMNMNYDDLFEGDFKYYNNARDFLKRTKESQAGGEGYAAYNSQVLETEILNNKIQDGTNQTEEVIKIKTKASDENGKDVYEPLVINGKQIVARNGFRGVTIYNTVKVSDYADEMQKSLYNDFIKNGMSEQVAYDKSVAIAAGYGHNQGEKTKINDAQSYITFEEFIRRRYADGTISEYYDLINQLLDDNVKVEDINIDDINARIQIGKNFYFDKPYDSRTGTFAPRQIKNAEFVLIPKLLPKDSELRKVYNWMMKNDIGQLNTAETSKAAKKNIFTIWDGKTGEFNKNFEETFTNDYVENYYYQYLYKQQDVPQHLVDEENKAGSQIMKKILDNIINNSDNSEHRKELVQWGKDFQNAYTANIQEKFNDFIDSMGWKYNAETKKIVNADGSEKLNYDKFYSRAREEASRLGMDSNFFDYITTDDFGNPIMPNCMNINMNKLESIAQACYNGTITRQTLPGWHAAQITAVGYSRKLKFDVKTGTMEVYLPRWSSKIPKYNPNDAVHKKMVEDAKKNKEYADLTNYEIFDKLIIKQIESEGLDLHIGYRIPTEGKQSVAILKVVGFTNDCLGSTIVVPDEWVTQTGSDFDVDSVYGISWELYTKKDKHGRITLHKIEYEKDKMDTKQMYLEYIKHKADVKAGKVDISEELAEEKDELFNTMKDEESAKRNKEFKKLDDKRQNAFSTLPRAIQRVIIKTNAKREFKYNGKVNIVKLYTTLKNNLIKTVENPDIKQILTEEDIENINEYCDYLQAIVNFVNDVQSTELVDITEFRSKKADIISNLLDKAKEERFKTAEQKAVSEGEISYDEFLKLPFEQQLSRRSRNNLILDRMMKIMQDFSSREEQLGRSNFDKITNGKNGANDIIDKISGKTSKPQSPYNVLDQLDYFEDAMGGARLKALSVTADTFVSKNNKIRAELSSDIVKVLIENDVEDSAIHYNIEEIEKNYSDDISDKEYNVEENKEINKYKLIGKFKVYTAKKLGWSNNNKNLVGEYVTTYTSQTTAHHLDAVKMGSVPNVNEYTFFTYKLLSMLGIDYENTIAFMRQPVITQLVMNNNLINSVFFKNTALDPIGMTFNSIAQKLNLGYIKNKKVRAIKNDTRINDTISAFINNSDFVNAFYNIYGIDISEIKSLKDLREITVPLSKSQMFERIKDKEEYNVYQAAIDFAMLTNFMNYKRISDNINNLMRATNVDKNGALQSIRENRKAIELIEKLRDDTTLMRGEQSFINAIFTPNIADSEYKSIDAIYQYVTLASNNTNENLFMLETANFDALTKRVEETIGRRLTENEYKEYKRYLMNYIYNSEDSVLLAPITIDTIGRVRKDTQAQSNDTYWNAERSRIFGFGRRFSESFDIEDINNPTKEDIAKFKRLSPAQKTLFIQKHFTENTGIFNYLNVTLYNRNDITYKGINRHYLSYNDQISDIEDLYHLFNMSYFNHNPLIKLAAIDLVKYAFIAEGFNFKSNYISKIIPNAVLYSETNDGGLDIISKIINDVHAFTNKMNDINEYDKFVNTFMRSHSNMIKEVTYNTESDSSFISNLATYTRQDRMIVIDASIDNWAIKKFIANTRANTNGYIKINYQNSKTIISRLYKIAGYGEIENGYKVYYFIPLNKLDSYESYDVSYNQNYNQVNDISYYYEVIRELNQGERAKTIIQPVGKFKYEFNNTIQDYQLINYLQEQEDIYLKGGVDKLIRDISHIYNSELFTENEANYIINNNRQLRNYITNKTTQLIEVNNTVMAVEITPVKVTPELASWIRHNIQLKNSGKDYDSKYLSIISDVENSQDIIDKSIIYKITKAKIDTETANKNIMDANTDLLVDTDENSLDVLPRRDVDIVSSSIINEIRYMARKYSSPIANSFMNTINRNKIDTESRESLKENREDIYRAAARYYKSAANGIINRLNKFNIEGVDYSMDSDKFYEVLKEHDELFPTVAKILLDGVTFGNRIIDIFSLDLTTDNLDTKNDIESIINSINSVRQNKKLADGMKKIFNIYMAKYSTNPAIVDNIMQLREAFGDLGTIDSWFADPTDIANPQVQVVLKHVMGTFSKAELFDAKQNVENWKKEVADIEKEPGELDYNKFIDSENGRIRDDFNQKFLEDRQKVIDDLNEARKHKYESVQKFREYLEASLARDKFYYENTNQRIVDDYYKEDIAAREEVLKNAGDYYVQFAMLASQLNNSDIEITETEEETKKRKSEIKQKMQWLRNTGSEEKSKEAKTAAAYINLYYQERIKRYEKYFDRQEYEGFAEDYERYKNFINAYNDKHPEYSLEEKLQNTTYREAYDWIRTNGRISFGKEGDDKVKQAFKILTNRSSRIDKSRIVGLHNIGADVFDEYGRLDPRKLTEKQLALFKSDEEQATTNMYNDGLGESILIKDVRIKRPILNTIKKKNAPSETTKRKWEINQKINSILSKCVDKNTGRLDYSMLFNDNIVTDEDRVALIKYYNELRTIQLNYDHKFENKFITEAIDDAAYNDAMNYYRTKLMNTKQGAQFIEIIHEKNAEGKYVPNYNLFGYIDILDESMIDEDRTAARNFINDNIEFETTEYYEEAKKAALAQGKEAYDKWFNANHIYDSFTHRYKPLNIWTEMRAIPGSSLDAGVEYIATGKNVESSVKEEYINKNYKELTNNYKKGNPKYDSNIKLSDKERKMRDLWVETLNKYATTYQGRQFVNKGYLPRERKQQINALWAAEQVGGLFGISIRSGAESDTFKDEVDYSHDKEAEMKMLTLIKAKGTREYIPLPQRGTMKEEEYKKKLEDVRKQNEEIKKQNEIIDKANINRDWKEVMEHFVHNATIFNSRQNAKPYLYLLLEDLRKNRAYMTKGIFNKRLSKDAERSTKDDTIYRTTEQKNTADLLHNFTRRILFEQYHENNIQRKVANFLQNLTSAKYMVFNVYGGIANVATGEVNIAMEAFAKEYFSFKDLANAKAQYVKALPNIIAKLYSEDSLDITSAFIKDFNIVDFDEILQYGEGSNNLDKYLKRARNFTYSLQSMGEHYMQNTVLLAMLKSNRLYQDSEGTMRIGDFKDYSRDIEKKAMQEVLSKYNGLLKHYNLYRDNLKYDIKGKYDIITGRKDINRNFLNSVKLVNRELYKQIAKEYHKKRKDMLKDANAEFNKNKTVESLYTFDNGHIKLTDEAIKYFNEKVGENKTNTIGGLEQLIGEFREKVIQVNKKIHGVYDKNGAAKIEKEWWGSIVMQYHKHLYPGIMKRWRRKGYYSETRGSNERGANQDLIDFLCTEFVDLNSISKEKAKNNNTNIVLASIQTAMLAGIDSIQNMMFNWDNLSEDERANIRRTFAENAAILSAVLFVMAIYATWDDDDIRNNGFVASLLYLSDRLYSDTTMYNPAGLVSEAKTTWSSPIASANGPSDFIKASILISQALFDPDYNPEYQTGQYAHKNKLEVLLRRNIPGLRPYDRIQLITRNNQYYKIGESQIGINIGRKLGEALND